MTTDPLYHETDETLPYCRGCGHGQVIRDLSLALGRLSLPLRSVVLTTDIGCLGLADSLFPHLHTVHTTHGRSTAFATGMSLAASNGAHSGLKPIVMIGDGGAMIGLLHLVHAAQLNVDITVLLHNNFVFGMTGGQHSALTPTGMVTSTTPDGNPVPPLDILAVVSAAHAGFLARHHATDAQLASTIADAIAFPGFALVEIIELCTAYATRRNILSGKTLRDWTEGRGLAVGRIVDDRQRPDFASQHRERQAAMPAGLAAERGPAGLDPVADAAPVTVPHASLEGELRVVVAGSAGERVQSSARLFCNGALAAGLYATQKNANPVTVGTGFSASEICLGPRPIDYTGIDTPDVVIVTSTDGWNHLQARGIFGRCHAGTTIVLDTRLDDPPGEGTVLRLPLRQEAGTPRAALAGLTAWSTRAEVLPDAAWNAATAALPESHRREAEKALVAGRAMATSIPTSGAPTSRESD